MTCTRCCGLMVTDHYMDRGGTAGYTWMTAWRCMNCGHVHDATIERNRSGATITNPQLAPARSYRSYDREEGSDAEDAVFLGADTLIPQAA